jgi:hypothetical protein
MYLSTVKPTLSTKVSTFAYAENQHEFAPKLNSKQEDFSTYQRYLLLRLLVNIQ